jgi:tetratricopeptide (TPR) repeat protein
LKKSQKIVDCTLKHRIKERLERKNLSSLEGALLQSALGNNLISEGEYADAFPIHLQAMETFKQLEQSRYTARTLNSLAYICRSINLLNLAEYYHSEAIVYVTPDFPEYYFTKISSFLMLSFNNKEAAIDSLLCLAQYAENNNLKELLPILYLNIGSFYMDTLPEEALTYFAKMETLDFDNPAMMGTVYANMGSYYLNKEDYPEALRYFKDAQKIMEANNDFFNLSSLYNDISFIFETLNQYDSALFYSRKNQELTLRLRSNLVAIETHQKYINTFLEASKNELIIAEQTIKLKNRQVGIIIIMASFTVLVILLLLLLTHQQKLRKASENRELVTKLEHEKRVQQYEKRQRKLEKEKHEAVIDAKTREITSYSMLVSNKNRMLKQIKTLTSQIFDNKEYAVRTAQKIDEIIQSNLNIDEEWENFKMHFDKVHPHFFEKLKQHCGDLTEENLKMCAYIKMRMTTKQIAQLLQVIPNSIITNRYRLKKKLNLADEEDLDGFIGEL